MSTVSISTPTDLDIRIEGIFNAPREQVYEVWTTPQYIIESHDEGTVVESMDVRPGGKYSFRMPLGPLDGEYLEVEPPRRLVQTFDNKVHPHVQTLEFEDLGGSTRMIQTMHFDTTEARDNTLHVAVEVGAEVGFERIEAILQRMRA